MKPLLWVTRILSVLRNLISCVCTLILFLTGFSHSQAAGFMINEINLVESPVIIKPPCDPLQPTLIDSVSVNPFTGAIRVSWFQNPSPDVVYYVVYVYNASTSPPWDAIDTVYGAANLSSTITNYNSATGSYTFAVSAHDNCGNSSFFSLDAAHNTIFSEMEYNACELEINLKWNKYKNWQNGVLNYKIWASVNNGAYQLIGVTSNTDTTFKHSSVSSQANICYYIQAISQSGNKTSKSNKTCVFTNFPGSPAFSYIRYATVTGNTQIKIAAYVDITANVLNYIIERKTTGTFATIAEISPAQITGDSFEYTDNDVKTNENSYVYRFKTINNCNKESGISNEAKTILLDVQNNTDAMVNSLKWNDYLGFDVSVSSYDIYRGVDGIYTKIASLPVGFNFYEDNISDFHSTSGEFCYFVKAIEGVGNVYDFKEESNSNQKCIEQSPFLYVPSAFTPMGNNPIFKPVFSFVEPSSYFFAIYNRWGERFFETSNTQTGWDGNTKNGPAPIGVYIYHIEYGSAFGQSFVKTGSVTLIR
ncbi:MAG: gliding motility-associated C-terminal domain-containing protein [Bacteroidetes bacterium]|nr:gliding motility-associated C-terminal domain-containing protein [Bacteroidota bacterium]HET6243375.1 gliding motility-associated C-terminal domain-containing protein [Bacteroidia bacterium]